MCIIKPAPIRKHSMRGGRERSCVYRGSAAHCGDDMNVYRRKHNKLDQMPSAKKLMIKTPPSLVHQLQETKNKNILLTYTK